MIWPAQSSDLNSTELICMNYRRLMANHRHPTSVVTIQGKTTTKMH